MLKAVPNIVSLSRVFGGWLAFDAIHHQNDWRMGFFLFLAALFTDYLDGWLAIRLNAISDLGKRWVDPLCDFALGMFVLAAYVLQDDMWAARLQWAIPMVLLAIIGKLSKEQNRWFRTKRVAYTVAPFYYLTCAAVFVHLVAQKGLYPSELAALNIALGPVILLAAYFKRHRLADWLHPNYSRV